MTINEPQWMTILREDLDATKSITKTAARVGVSRPALSQILNGIGPYGTGKASTDHIAKKVMSTIGMVACPFLSDYHASEQRITGLQCREYAYRVNPPTNSPRDMQHWRACQGCEKRVPPASVIVPPPTVAKPAKKLKVTVKHESEEQLCAAGHAAHHEGWSSLARVQDNPYASQDTRHDHWENGRNARSVFDLKQRNTPVDISTLPLPEVGAPQLEESA